MEKRKKIGRFLKIKKSEEKLGNQRKIGKLADFLKLGNQGPQGSPSDPGDVDPMLEVIGYELIDSRHDADTRPGEDRPSTRAVVKGCLVRTGQN